MNPEQLQLRDIHLPEAVGWWPPAPGWWIVAMALLAVVFALVVLIRRRAAWRRSAVFVARGELDNLKAAWNEHRDAHRLITEVSIWLRRVSMSLRSRQQVASLTGAQWWRYLDELAGTPVFGPDGGKLIGEAPYRATAVTDDAQRALTLCDRWLDALSDSKRVVPS